MSVEPQSFDPYREWLGIEPQEQPADHYRLLGVARFESDMARIARVADEQMALVRSFQTGRRAAYTQKLLNELAAARVCLLNPQTKAQYDAELGRRLAALLIVRKTIAAAPVQRASEPVSLAEERPAESPSEEQCRALSWRPVLLVAAILLAILIAIGGWTYGRSRLGSQPAVSRSSDKEQSSLPEVTRKIVIPDDGGQLTFEIGDAKLAGEVRRTLIDGREVLANWASAEDQASWAFRGPKPGFYKAELIYATSDVEEAELELRIDDKGRRCSLRSSGGLDQFVTDAYTVAVPKSGLHELTIQPRGERRGEWLVLRSVRFIPLGAEEATAAP